MAMSTAGKMKEVSAIDLFCGVGGMTHGFILEGVNVIAGIDADPSCRYAFEVNNDAWFIEKSADFVQGDEIGCLFPDGHYKVLIGCAPCQPFSRYTRRDDTSKEWGLLYEFSRLIRELEPDVVSMENVPELATRNRYRVFDDFVEQLDLAGYFVSYYIVFCPDYGIPQNRTRLVLFASKYDKVDLLDKTHSPEKYRTVKDSIGHLPPISAGETCPDDPLHRSSRLSDLNLKRIRASVPGGTWRDWSDDLQLTCHKRSSGKSYPAVYGRMSWDEPAPTITTQAYGYGNGRFGHPEQDRALSLREAALLQTFPEDYDFVDPDNEFSLKSVGRHVGNAVPVDLGRIVARSIIDHLEECCA